MNVATEANSEGVAALQERLADPQTTQALGRLLDRLDVLAFLLDSADGFLSRGETVADSIAAGFAELKRAEVLPDENPSDSLQGVAEALPELAKVGGQVTRLAGSCDLEAVAGARPRPRPEFIGSALHGQVVNRRASRLKPAQSISSAWAIRLGEIEFLADEESLEAVEGSEHVL